jgi:hypothetical protein
MELVGYQSSEVVLFSVWDDCGCISCGHCERECLAVSGISNTFYYQTCNCLLERIVEYLIQELALTLLSSFRYSDIARLTSFVMVNSTRKCTW